MIVIFIVITMIMMQRPEIWVVNCANKFENPFSDRDCDIHDHANDYDFKVWESHL